MSDSVAKDFAGNAYTAVAFAAILIGILVDWPWPTLEFLDAPGCSDVNVFLQGLMGSGGSVDEGDESDDLDLGDDARELQRRTLWRNDKNNIC